MLAELDRQVQEANRRDRRVMLGAAGDVFVSDRQIADALGVEVKAVARMEQRGELPPAARLGNRRVWSRETLEKHVKAAEAKAVPAAAAS